MERAVRARKEESSSQGCGWGCTGSGGMLSVSMETGASFWCAGDMTYDEQEDPCVSCEQDDYKPVN